MLKKMTLIEWIIIIALIGIGVTIVSSALTPKETRHQDLLAGTDCLWWDRWDICVCLGEASLGKRTWAFTAPARVCDGEPPRE